MPKVTQPAATEVETVTNKAQAETVPAKKAKAARVPAATQPKPKTKSVEHEYGVARSHDLPWCEKKVSVFKALKALRAVSPQKAQSAQTIAEKANVTARDVRHYCYHAKAAGLTDLAEIEGTRGYAFFLTAAGAAINPDKALKDQAKS